ncbi:MAG: hypothetical protein EXQ85_10470 [Alphaproteobacteria bacterium]|nr:hypothetical protein [Alphaproteobacteria bacterium]
MGAFAWTDGSLAAGPKDTLRIGVYSKAPTRGNPFMAATVPATYFWDGLYDSLTRTDGQGQAVPWLAEKWEIVDPLTWRFTSRANVVFSNGAKLDAAGFDSVKALDERTLEIKTKTPDPLLVRRVSGIYFIEPKAWRDSIEAYTAKPVTSGSWLVTSWNDNDAEFAAFDKSWRPGKIKTLKFVELPEAAARLQALVSDQVDFVMAMTPDDIGQVKNAGHQVITGRAPNVVTFVLFTKDPKGAFGAKGSPFQDVRVRQAVNYAIDRKALTEGLMNGLTEPSGQPATPSTYGFNPDVKPYPYDPDRAKKLLADAGYPNGFQMVAEVMTGVIPRDREFYTYVADAMGKIGIKVDMRVVPFSDWVAKLRVGNWEGIGTGFSPSVDPFMDATRPFAWYSCAYSAQFVCVDRHMPLLHQANVEVDPTKREAIVKNLMKAANEDALAIYLFNGIDVFAANKRVKDFTSWHRTMLYEKWSLAD